MEHRSIAKRLQLLATAVVETKVANNGRLRHAEVNNEEHVPKGVLGGIVSRDDEAHRRAESKEQSDSVVGMLDSTAKVTSATVVAIPYLLHALER